jgi:enamine deaminase RidA (YjgF/YER057c/UK114 family)
MNIENRLQDLGIVLPPTPAPLANYGSFTIAGDLLFLAGQGPQSSEGTWYVGKVGEGISVEEAY